MTGTKPRLLLVSHVWPFPGNCGQQQRVALTVKALRRSFDVTFLTVAPQSEIADVSKRLMTLCDAAIILPSRYSRSIAGKLWHRTKAAAHSARTGLRMSNYFIGKLELSPDRLLRVLNGHRFDVALFEYWHAFETAQVMRSLGIPCLLDTHDILWQSYQRDLEFIAAPEFWKRRTIAQYKEREENAWKAFDALIAINGAEDTYIREKMVGKKVFYAPMGISLADWPYEWQPIAPPRICYYGGLGSRHNQESAIRCAQSIMPGIWKQHPTAELWLVGSNPSSDVQALTADSRIKVPGFVAEVQPLLASMSVVLCPWSGTYGFRSRLIEVMATGVPVVASADAVYGMGFDHGVHTYLAESDEEFTGFTLDLLSDGPSAQRRSISARARVEEAFGFERTYGRLAADVSQWLQLEGAA